MVSFTSMLLVLLTQSMLFTCHRYGFDKFANLRNWTRTHFNSITSHEFDYTLEGIVYEGYVSYPTDVIDAELPGILIGHQWMGLGQMEKFRADEMASYGYVSFALDVYGKGIRPKTPEEARGNVTKLKSNPEEFHKRVNKGLEILTNLGEGPVVNKSAMVANGYCFGGLMVLELARQGTDLVGVSSFHGDLGALLDPSKDNIKAAIQVHHADLDSQGADGLLKFEDEMRNNRVKTWATTKYGNCYHGWTEPNLPVYNEQAAKQSHASMRHFYSYLMGNIENS